MADELSIRLRVQEENVAAQAATPPGASAAAAESAVAKLGGSAAFSRASKYWELDVDRLEHRLFHGLTKAGIRFFAGQTIGELAGVGLGGGFVGNLASRAAAGFAFGGPTGLSIALLHQMIESLMERFTEQSKRIDEQNRKLSTIQRDFEKEASERRAADVLRELELAQEIRDIQERIMKEIKQSSYELWQYTR